MPGILQLVTVTKTPQRIQSFMVQNSDFMLVNPDITNNIFIGNDQGSQLIAVPPLGSISLSGSNHDTWVSTGGVAITVSAYLMPGGTNWTPSPAQVAAQINALGLAKDTTVQSTNTISTNTNTILGTPAQNATVAAVTTALGTTPQKSDVNAINTTLGVPAQTGDVTGLTTNGIPPLRGTTQLGQASAQSLALAGTVTLLNAVAINKPGFEAVFKLNLPAAAGTVPFAILTVGWQDAVTGLQVGIKQYALTAGNGPANALMFYLSGPCRGNQLVLTLQNLDPAQILTYSWLFNLTSHTYLSDRLIQPSYAATPPITFGNPAGNPAKGLLFASAPAIGPNGTIIRLCAASNHKCKLNIDDSGQLNAWSLAITDPGTLYNATAGNGIYKFNGVAGSVLQTEIQLPNGPTLFTLGNSQVTNTITLAVTVTAMEY